MSDPVIRRLQCEATLYLEVAGDGLSLARLVVDVALPDPSVIVANLPSPFDTDPEEDTGPWTQAEEAAAAAALETFPSGSPQGGWKQGVPF